MGSIDTTRWLKLSAHLDRALDLSPIEREAFLTELRASDPETASELARMLDEHRQLSEQGFLDSSPARATDATLSGVIIGAYTLISRIGEGGMGTVWLGQRSDGRYEGQVAIKLLNAALVGRGGEERFRREGSILARLGHPHIARLIDAGVSNTGQPYLVLELVNGEHIDAYCDERRLTIERRIRLFLDVLAAVSHAHANLIVHSDIKPSNVLVNQSAAVKLLDFSIAKLVEDEGVSRLTRDGSSALTPKYAAPEQINGEAITTRTDVYALGVLLFELLTAQHPYGPSIRSSPEFIHAIVHEEPLRLTSAFAKASADTRSLAAAQRLTTPDRLIRALSGDLDTILNKALKKSPGERYGSVAEFADDLRRYLDHQPIAARPDTVRYRTGKFIKRHGRAVSAVGAVTAAIVVIVAFYTVQLTNERDRARAQAEKASRVSELLAGVLYSADPYRNPDNAAEGVVVPSARGLLDTLANRITTELSDQPEVQAEMLTLIGRTYERIGMTDRALPLLEQSLAIGRKTFPLPDARVAQTLNDLGVLQRRLGNLDAAVPLLIEALSMRRALYGNDHQDVGITLSEYGRVLRDLGRLDDSERATRDALAIRIKNFGDEHRETATNKSDLGQLLMERGQLDEAERLFRENQATTERILGLEHLNSAAAKNFVGNVLAVKGDLKTAERLQRDALAVRQRVFGPTNPESAFAVQSLAFTLEMEGRLAESEALLNEAYPAVSAAYGADHSRVVNVALDLARVRIALGRGAEVESMARTALLVRQRTYPAGHWRIAEAQALLGASLLAQHRDTEAEPLMAAADKAFNDIPGRQARDRQANRARLISVRARSSPPANHQ